MNKFLIRPELSVLALLLCVASIAVYIGYGFFQSLPLGLLLLLILVVFRNPPRATPNNALAIVAPIDSVVEDIQSIFCNEINQDMTLVRLRRRHLGIMALYSPIQGQLLQTWYGNQYARYAHENCNDQGHVYSALLKNNESDKVMMCFYRSKTIRYLKIRPQPGERIGQGRLMGLSSIRYVDILIPQTTKLKVKIGHSLKAGQSTIALLVHKKKSKSHP